MVSTTVHQLILFAIVFIGLTDCKKHRAATGKRDMLAESTIFSSDYFQADEAAIAYSSGATGSVLPVNHPSQQKCVDIPHNMSLCQGIGYGQMLIPNLMEHETVREANEQSQTWMPLANIKCHQHTRLFLCSLFAPICPMQQPSSSSLSQADANVPADQALIASGPVIFPCRSLCESVKQGCQGVMSKHGFPWPEMLSCARFPLDNDMCISPNPGSSGGSSVDVNTKPTLPPAAVATTVRSTRTRRPSVVHHRVTVTMPKTTTRIPVIPQTTTPAFVNLAHDLIESCQMCSFVVPAKQLDTAFCQADFVAKVRFRRFTRRGVFLVKKPRILKLTGKLPALANHTLLEEELKNAKSVEFLFEPEKASNTCRHLCAEKVDLRSQLYLVMGVFIGSKTKASTHPTIGGSGKSGLPQIGMHLILPWFSGENSKDFRQTEKRLLNLKCASRPDGMHLPSSTYKKAQRSKKTKVF